MKKIVKFFDQYYKYPQQNHRINEKNDTYMYKETDVINAIKKRLLDSYDCSGIFSYDVYDVLNDDYENLTCTGTRDAIWSNLIGWGEYKYNDEL